MKQPMKFMTNDPELLAVVTKRCTNHEVHAKVEGRETKRSQEYQPALCRAILRHLRGRAREREPTRFIEKAPNKIYHKAVFHNRRGSLSHDVAVPYDVF